MALKKARKAAKNSRARKPDHDSAGVPEPDSPVDARSEEGQSGNEELQGGNDKLGKGRGRAEGPGDMLKDGELDQAPVNVVICPKPDSVDHQFARKKYPFLVVPPTGLGEEIIPSPWRRTLQTLLRSKPKLKDFVKGNQATHQSLVTSLSITEQLRETGNVSTEITHFAEVDVGEFEYQPGSTTIFLLLDTGMPDPKSQMWDDADMVAEGRSLAAADEIADGRAMARIYPNRIEMESDNGKIHDIRALDEVAAAATDETLKYRPTTCFGRHGIVSVSTPLCDLRDHPRTVYKRSWSGFTSDVAMKSSRDPRRLTCFALPPPTGSAGEDSDGGGHRSKRRRTRGRRKSAAGGGIGDQDDDNNDDKPRSALDFDPSNEDHLLPDGKLKPWFHQEYVESLRLGKFRVFLATRPSNKGDAIRGRRGYVMHWIHTACRLSHPQQAVRDHTLVTQPFDACAAEFSEKGTSIAAVKRFALATFEALRARNDPAFKSLDVGCRLDIGSAPVQVGEKKKEGGGGGTSLQGRLFVNEITRWYGAHYYSASGLPSPWTQICSVYANAFAEWIEHRGYLNLQKGRLLGWVEEPRPNEVRK